MPGSVEVAMKSWRIVVMCCYTCNGDGTWSPKSPRRCSRETEHDRRCEGPCLSMTGRVELDCDDEFISVGRTGWLDSVRTSEAETCLRGGHEARVKKKSIMRMVRNTLMKGEARWRGKRITPSDLPRLFHGGSIEQEKQKLAKLRARNKVIKAKDTENLRLKTIEVSSYNVQTLRPLERPMEITRKLAGTIIGMQGTRYSGTRRREWTIENWQFFSR